MIDNLSIAVHVKFNNTVFFILCKLLYKKESSAHLAGTVEYTDCTSVDPANECPVYDTKQFDGEVPVILLLWGMWSTPSLPFFSGPLRPGMVASD